MNKENSFNPLRLILASLVLISHSSRTSGHPFDFNYGIIEVGTLSTFGFFAISGFLVTPGVLKWGLIQYLLRRCSRIFPGYWGVSVVTVIIFRSIWERLGNTEKNISFTSTIYYLINNIVFLPTSGASPSSGWNLLQGLPTDVPSSGIVNISMWTLSLEFMSYIFIGILTVILNRIFTNHFKQIFNILVFVLWLISIYSSFIITSFWIGEPTLFTHLFGKWPYLLSFFIGSALSFQSQKISKYINKFYIIPLLFISYISSYYTETWALSGSLAFTLAVIFIGSSKLLYRFSTKTDISYGIYLYHYPVLQTLAYILDKKQDRLLLITSCLIISGIFAYLSAKLIEEPALKWARGKTN